MKGEKKPYCVPDLQKERENCWFDQEEITNMLDGDKDKTELRRKLQSYFFNDPEFNDPIPPDYLSHEDKYANELRKSCAITRKLNENEDIQQLAGQMDGMRILVGSGIGSALVKDGNPLGVHYVMFLPFIMSQGSLEQQAVWMQRAWAGEIIGTYAQTEMGHGTYLRGLETTATYDPLTEEFVLHSPTISSYKFWPGGLGKTANYAIVMAQLYTKGKCYGPHGFMVQLRDEESHHSLPGVEVGEIGPRFGMNTNDNGFLGFKNYRIPRTNMMMKHSQVLKDGSYLKPPSEKLAYGTMVFVRVAICFDAARQLQRAVTIATRYSAVRRQSELIAGAPEPQIMDYQTQQEKLFPHLSATFALIFASRSLWDTYVEVTQSVEEGNLELLPELHALSCGLKAQCSADCTMGIDICRRACGGNGYLSSSNLGRIFTASSAAMTYEGENTVMWLQLARYVIKVFRQGKASTANSLSYLHESQPVGSQSDLSNQGLLLKWQQAVTFKMSETVKRLDHLQNVGQQPSLAWNQCSVELVKCAQAHIRYFTCNEFVKGIGTLELSPGTMNILSRLCRLYLIYHVIENQGIFLRSGIITSQELTLMEVELCELFAIIRPNAVNLVDAFDIHDRVLDSTLGAWDGNVYQRMYDEAKKSPLNKRDVPDAYYKYLRPLMKSNL